MYEKNHYNIVISLQLIKINEKKRTVLSEIRQRQINTVLSHLYVSSLKKKIKLIDIENRLVVVRGRGEGGEQNG